MEQSDSLFWIGRKVGELEARQAASDGRILAIEALIETGRRYAVRGLLLVALWSGVIGAGLSRDELSALLAAAIRKVLSIG